MGKKVKCQNCEGIYDEDEIIPLEMVRDLFQRIAPGEVVPVGECRRCGALCHYTDDEIPEVKPLTCARCGNVENFNVHYPSRTEAKVQQEDGRLVEYESQSYRVENVTASVYCGACGFLVYVDAEGTLEIG